MKRTLYFLLLAFISISISCKDRDPGLRFAENTGFNLYWHHTAGLDRGRHLLLDFISAKSQREEFEFKFDYKIKDREITITLREAVSKGKCPEFPGPWGNECTSNGTVFIPESELSQGEYKFTLKVDDRKVISILRVDADKYILKIPPNDFFNSNIQTVYPLPKDLIFGSIIYFGSSDEHLANSLISDLERLGLTVATIPDYPYRDFGGTHLKHLEKKFWEPDNYSVYVLLHMNAVSIRTVFEMVRKNYDATGKKLRLGLFCSNNMEQLSGGPDSELDVLYDLK